MKRWKLVSSETVIHDQWMTIERNAYLSPGGPIDPYYVIRRRPFVIVVAENTAGVVLIRQYRPATGHSYWSLPAGYIDTGEAKTDAALRELREETGLLGTRPRIVARVDPLPGYVDSRGHVVHCRLSARDAGVRDGEVERVLVTPWNVVRKMIAHGLIVEMQALAALLLVNPQTRPSSASRP